MIESIISGGQTGVDRAALDSAIALNIKHNGWCPKGRKAEDGEISSHYHLQETESEDYSERTLLNIEHSDGTLIFVPSLPITVNDGTILTIKEVYAKKKPHLIIDLSQQHDITNILKAWILKNNIKILNVAGPRESQCPGVYTKVCHIFTPALEKITQDTSSLGYCSIPKFAR